jgi:lipopolysaccharide biosynthesis protein
MLGLFARYPPDTEFLFTTPIGRRPALEALLKDFGRPRTVIEVENRGRDVAPFLQALSLIWGRRFRFVLKLHTKRSDHRSDGEAWRKGALDAIAEPSRLVRILERLDSGEREGDDPIGVVGAAEHLVSVMAYAGSSAARTEVLGRRLGLAAAEMAAAHFVAGTMFVARLEALEPLMGLSLSLEDFEPESGQIDGALAHAIERAIAFSAVAAQTTVRGVAWRDETLEFVEGSGDATFAFAGASGLQVPTRAAGV